MDRIGILGGTFDPPHIGHLILGEFAVDALKLAHLLFVPAADPPHKQDESITAVEDRLEMLDCALAGNNKFSISRIDVDRPGPHYSVDMVRLVAEEYPSAELYFVMGSDSLRNLPTWHQPAALMQLCRLAVMRRPGDEATPEMHEPLLPGLSQRVVMIDAPLIDISSTHITERLREGSSVRYLMPDAVLDYIQTKHIYGS